MVLFFSIFFLLYILINYYILKRAFQSFRFSKSIKIILSILFFFFTISYFLAEIIFKNGNTFLYDLTLWIGSFWFAIVLYLILFILLIDLIRIINKRIHFLPKIIFKNYEKTKSILGLFIIIFTVIIVGYGYINASNVKLKEMEIYLPKKNSVLNEMSILYFSDSHFTPVNNGRILNQIINISKQTKPDLILIGGDVVDDKSKHLIRYGIDTLLQKLNSKYGVYTCNGNHEFIVDINDADKFLNKNKIKVLIDSIITIENSIQIVGRQDRSSNRFSNMKRNSLNVIMKNVNKDLPTIVLDHQPINLSEAANNKIDFQLSGHTHHGQLFPFNFLTELIYEVSWGYYKKGKTQYYISCGVGTWGPPVRIGSEAEILLIKIKLM